MSAAMRSGRRLALIGPYPAPWGGIAVHVQALQRLAIRNGFEVEVLDVGENHAQRTGAAGVRNAGSHARFAAELIRSAAREALLHVHIPGNNAKAWWVAFAASRMRPGGLLTVHSGLAPALLDGSPGSRRIAWLAAAGYARIFCANEGIAAALSRCHVTSGRLEVLPAFVSGAATPSEPPAAARAARRRFDHLLTAALAPGRQYGEDILFAALEQLRERSPGIGCVVYGPGTADAAFSERVARLGLGEMVVSLGEIDQPASLGVMQMADLFLRPTRADGDSISVREAIGLGIRVIASDVGSRPREAMLFRSGEPGDLVAKIEAALAPVAETAGRYPAASNAAPDRNSCGGDASERILSAWRGLGRPRGRQGAKA